MESNHLIHSNISAISDLASDRPRGLAFVDFSARRQTVQEKPEKQGEGAWANFHRNIVR
jgi:hypothetical protein